MTWKHDLKLADLEDQREIEVTCKKCGRARYEIAGELMKKPSFKNFYLDEVERALRCHVSACKGPVKIALTFDHKMEKFIGGMP